MKICRGSLCSFECHELGKQAKNLAEAIEWLNKGFNIDFVFNGEKIGVLTYAGSFPKVEELPEDSEYGTVFLCEEDNAFYLSMPDSTIEQMPEE